MERFARRNHSLEIQAALEALVANPEVLERSRQRFEDVQYRDLPAVLHPDEAPTPPLPPRSPSSLLQQLREDKLKHLRNFGYRNAHPRSQFKWQTRRLAHQIQEVHPGAVMVRWHRNMDGLPEEYLTRATDCMRQRWKDQGIWDDEWQTMPPESARWMHELPMSDNPQSSSLPQQRDASRPCFQFVYQVQKEIGVLLGYTNEFSDYPVYRSFMPQKQAEPDIGAKAYERVKAAWEQEYVWDSRWGVLPGLSWMHELPVEEFVRIQTENDIIFAEPPPENMVVVPNDYVDPRDHRVAAEKIFKIDRLFSGQHTANTQFSEYSWGYPALSEFKCWADSAPGTQVAQQAHAQKEMEEDACKGRKFEAEPVARSARPPSKRRKTTVNEGSLRRSIRLQGKHKTGTDRKTQMTKQATTTKDRRATRPRQTRKGS